MTTYCCRTLTHCINDPRIPVNYDPSRRRYSIDGGETGTYTMNVCFWCDYKFPKNLSEEFCDIFYNELKLEDDDEDKLPEEFKSDEWWKKRGL